MMMMMMMMTMMMNYIIYGLRDIAFDRSKIALFATLLRLRPPSERFP